MPIKAAQIFKESSHAPKKASLYLNPVGLRFGNYFFVNDNITIDALNYSDLSQKRNKILVEEDVPGSTGHGVLRVYEYNPDSEYSRIKYPISCSSAGTYRMWLRVQMPGGVFDATVLRDGEILFDIGESGAASSNFVWISSSFIAEDTNSHIFSIRPETDSVTVDKIYITNNLLETPTGEGSDFDISPYLTIHCRVYTTDVNHNPLSPLFIYDYKTTISDVSVRGWYNFDLSFVNNLEAINFDGVYAVVLFVSGSDNKQYVVWEYSDDSNTILMGSDIKGNLSVRAATYLNKNYADWTHNETNFAIKMYYFSDNYGYDSEDKKVSIEAPTESVYEIMSFDDDGAVLNSTKIEQDAYGQNDIVIDYDNKLVTFLFDESGSMLWRDPNALRHSLAKKFIQKVSDHYSGDVDYRLFKFGGKHISLLLAVDKESVSPLVNTSDKFFQQYFFRDPVNRFAGIRIVRRIDGYPSAPIDGEIVFDGIANEFIDTDVSSGNTYYYAIYTFDEDYNFGDGVFVNLSPTDSDSPVAFKNIEHEVLRGSGTIVDDYILVAWHFDEQDGEKVYDFNAQFDLTLSETENVWIVNRTLPFGRSGLRFNGISTIASTDQNSSFQLDGNRTFIVKCNCYDSTFSQTVFSRNNGLNNDYSLYVNSDRGLTFEVSGVSVSSDNGVIKSNTDIQIAVVIDQGTGLVEFYIDNDFVGGGYLSVEANNEEMYFEVGSDSSDRDTFFGEIFDFTIHSCARNNSYIINQNSIQGDDNGDRLIVFRYIVPETYPIGATRFDIVENAFDKPSCYEDGEVVLSQSISSHGKFYVTYRREFVLGYEYYYSVYTVDHDGVICENSDCVSMSVNIPDITKENRDYLSLYGLENFNENNISWRGLLYPGGNSYGFVNWDVLEESASVLSSISNVTVSTGDRKLYISWLSSIIDDRAKRIRIYKKSISYPTVDDMGNNNGVLIYECDIDDEGYVDRYLDNGETYYYAIIVSDRYNRVLASSIQYGTPMSGVDEEGIPLMEIDNVRYEILSGSKIKLMWDRVIQNRNVQCGFNEDVLFYIDIIDEDGNNLSDDYTVEQNVSVQYEYFDDVGVDVFEKENSLTSPSSNDFYNFTTTGMDSGGIIGTLSFNRDQNVIKNIKSVNVDITLYVVLYNKSNEKIFNLQLAPINVIWENMFDVEIENIDGSYVLDRVKQKISCLNDQVPTSIRKYDGVYVGSSHPYRMRIYFYDDEKSNVDYDNSIFVKIYDADMDLLDPDASPVRRKISSSVKVKNALQFKSGVRYLKDANGNNTGESHPVVYADLELTTPDQPQVVIVYIKFSYLGLYDVVKKKTVVFGNPLKIELMPRVPVSDGRQVAEQSCAVYMVDPDHPDDVSKRTNIPNGEIVKWKMYRKSGHINRVLYSQTDILGTTGICSYIDNGLAKNVFLGPITNAEICGYEGEEILYEEHTIEVSISYDDLIAVAQQDITILPLVNRGHDVTYSHFMMEFENIKQKLYTDGISYVALMIPHSIDNPNSKYASSFYDYMLYSEKPIFTLGHGNMVHIDTGNPNVEIIWGDVNEYLDPYLNRWLLNTDNANISYGSASVNLSEYDETYIYFRLLGSFSDQRVLGFEKNTSGTAIFGSKLYSKYNDEIVVSGTIINDFNGTLTSLSGGGSLSNGILPSVIVPERPLKIEIVGRRKRLDDITSSSGLVIDGETYNQFILDVSCGGVPVPDDTTVDINVINYTEDYIAVSNKHIKTSLFVDPDIDPDNSRSYATLELLPIQPHMTIISDVHLRVLIDLEDMGFEKKKKVSLSTCIKIRCDKDDYREDESSTHIKSIFSDKLWAYDSSIAVWTEKESMGYARGHLCSEYVNSSNKIYAIGGVDIRKISNQVEEYDIDNDVWTVKSPMSHSRMAAMSVVVGNYIYVIGGVTYDDSLERLCVCRYVERYDTVNNSWEEMESMPLIDEGSIDRIPYGVAHGVALYDETNNRIYVLSGIKGITEDANYVDYNDRILYYDITDDMWSYSDQVTSDEILSYKKISPIGFWSGSNIVVFGGAYQKSDSMYYDTDSYKYNTVDETINENNNEFSNVPSPKYFSSYSSNQNGLLYIVGGSHEQTETARDFGVIDTETSPYDYSKLIDINHGINGSSLVCVNNIVMIVGGIRSGKGRGFLQLEIDPYEDRMLLDGNNRVGIKVSLRDENGECNIVDGNLKIKAYLQEKTFVNEEIILSSLSDQIVLFDYDEFNVIDDYAVFCLKAREDDPIFSLSDLSFVEDQDANRYKIILQAMVSSGDIDISTSTVSNVVRSYGINYVGYVDSLNDISDLSQSCDVNAASNVWLSSLSQPKGFSLISDPLEQKPAVSIMGYAKDPVIPYIEDLTDNRTVGNTEAINLINTLSTLSPYGPSPLFDTIVNISDVLSTRSLDNKNKMIISLSDDNPNSSFYDINDTIDRCNSIDKDRDTPIIVGNLGIHDPYLIASYLSQTGSRLLDTISYYTGGQSFSVVDEDFLFELVCSMIGRMRGSLGYGSAEYVVDMGKIVRIKNVVVYFDIPENTDGYWTVSVSDNKHDYGPQSVSYFPNEDIDMQNAYGRYVKFVFRLNTCLTLSNYEDGSNVGVSSPSVESISIIYVSQKEDYIYLKSQNIDSTAQQMALSVDTDVKNYHQGVNVGISGSHSHEWPDFNSPARPNRYSSGRIVLNNRDVKDLESDVINFDNSEDVASSPIFFSGMAWGPVSSGQENVTESYSPLNFDDLLDGPTPPEEKDTKVIRSEPLNSIDGIVFRAQCGPWDYAANVIITDSDNNEISSDEYTTYPREGVVVFDTMMYGFYYIGIDAFGENIYSAVNIYNSDIDNDINIYGLGNFYSITKSCKDYLVEPDTSSIVSVSCAELPWLTCTAPGSVTATVSVDAQSGVEIYDKAHGNYIYHHTLETTGLVGWWYEKTDDSNIVLVIAFCKSNEKYYAEVFDRGQDLAIFGADPNESECVTLEKDRLKDLSSFDFCCDSISNQLVGNFTLAGLGEYVFYDATVTLSIN